VLFTGHHAFAQGWTQLPDFPGTARDDAASFVIGRRIYVGTGRDVDFALRNDWYAFDEILQVWGPIAPLPSSGRQYCAAFSADDHGYLFGGIDDTGPLNELWRYDATSNSWEQLAPLPGPGRYAAVAFDTGLICTGMLNNGIPTNETWKYDVASDSWSQRTPVPGPPRHRASGGGAFELIAGGANAEFEALSDVYFYDQPSGAWYPSLDLPGPRYGADGSNNFVVGGASTTDEYHDDTWMFYSAWGWTFEVPFPGGPRRGGVMAAIEYNGLVEGQFYYGTGVDLTERKKDWWRFDYSYWGVEEHGSRSLTGYPNPTNGHIFFALSGHDEKLSFEVFDITGRRIQTGTLRSGIPLDVSDKEPGRYLVIIRVGGISYHSHFTLIP